MNWKNVVVAGGGVLGSQIAYQTAFKGFNVKIWLRSEGSIERAKPKMERLHKLYLQDLEACKAMIGKEGAKFPRGLIDDPENLTVEKVDALKVEADRAFNEIRYCIDMGEACEDADIIIESVAEKLEEKIDFFEKLAPHVPEKTVIVTNSSTLLPSSFAEATGRPHKFLALHFANNIWRNNVAEVMGHAGTEQTYFDQVVAFAKQIGMIPLKVLKEQPGYLLNSLLVPFLSSAEALLVNGVSDPETIDLAWVYGTGAPYGPFRILDVVGLETAYNIVMNHPNAQNDPESIQARIAKMLKEYIDAGKTGVNAGEGFYKYK